MPDLAINGGTPVRDRAFHPWPVTDKSDADAVASAVLDARWDHFSGPNLIAFEHEFAALQDCEFGIACNGGTTALEIALQAVGIGLGDEVIVPAYTFVATAVAVLRVGAAPVFCDVEEDTFNIDCSSAERCVTDRTKAIMPVHYGGRAVNFVGIEKLAEKHDLKVIEDACHGWGASWRSRGLGSLGEAAGFSFQASKNLTCGEGGFVTTNRAHIAEIASRIRHGGDGEKDGKPVVLPGNFRMSEIQAALLRSQLRRLPEQNRTRMHNAEYLSDGLEEIDGIRVLRRDPDVTKTSVHVYLSRFIADEFDEIPRGIFIDAMVAEGIPLRPGYKAPLQEYELFAGGSPPAFAQNGGSMMRMYDHLDYSRVKTPVASRLCLQEAMALSQSIFLGPRTDMDSVVEAAAKIRDNVDELRHV